MKIMLFVLHRFRQVIKSNIIMCITLNLFLLHDLNILQIKSCDNLADLFTKSLPSSLFEKYINGIGMKRLRDLQSSGGVSP